MSILKYNFNLYRLKTFNKIFSMIKARNLSTQLDKINTTLINPETHQNIETNLKSAIEIEDVFKIIRENTSKMTLEQLIHSMETVLFIKKYKREELPFEEIMNSEEFKTLCYQIKTQIRSLSLSDHVTILKCLTFLNIPKNSTITQVVLKMILHQVNDLRKEEIGFIKFLMSHLQTLDGEETPIFNALNVALEYVYKIKIDEQKDPVFEALKYDYPELFKNKEN